VHGPSLTEIPVLHSLFFSEVISVPKFYVLNSKMVFVLIL